MKRTKLKQFDANKEQDKCPECGRVNKHIWGDKLASTKGSFVVKCGCGTIYLQALT